MSPEQITLAQSSFELIKPIKAVAGSLFYKNLFEIAPELRPLFKGDVDAQGHKLIETLEAVVDLLENSEKLLPTIKQLGVRHANYAVKNEHFAPVGQALITTLEQGLGAHFTGEVKAAWVALYKVATQVMIEGLEEGRAA